jgi:GNAT superfamily N-acetyltransferase
MPFYFDQGGTDQYTLQDFEPSYGTKLSAAISEAWSESYGPETVDWIQANFTNQPKISAAEANELIKASGRKLNITPKDGEYSKSQIELLIERQRERTAIQDIRERTPWDWGTPVRGLAMFGAGIVDPANLLTAIIPWSRAVQATKSLQAATQSSSLLTRTGGRAGLGAIDATISTAALEPFYAYIRRDLGDDYDALDSIANIAFGAAFGGGVLGIGGLGVDAFRRATGRTLPSDRFTGLSVKQIQDVTNFQRELTAGGIDPAAIRSTLDSYTPEMRRAAGFPEYGQVADGNTTPTGNSRTARVTEMDGVITVRDKGGNVFATQTDTSMRIDNIAIRESMQRQGYGTALVERLVNEAAERGLDVETPSIMTNAEARFYESLADRGLNVRKAENTVAVDAGTAFPEGGIRSADGSPMYRIERGEGYEPPVDRARDITERIAPETREAAMRGGLAQLMDGREVDVEPIINTDGQAAGDVTAADLQASAELNLQPEAVRTADFDASESIEFENQTSQAWDNVSDAELAMRDADAQLEQTIKAGADAFKYARAKATGLKPGVGVEPGNKLGFEPDLRVKVNTAGMELPKKALILQKTNIGNAQSQIDAIDEILGMFPNAHKSPSEWARMQAYAFASDEVPIPPYAFIRDVNSDLAAAKLTLLTPGQIEDANAGFVAAEEFRRAYTNNELSVETTGKLFLWSFLSRGVSPYTQEGLFVDSFGGINKWIDRAAAGQWDENAVEVYNFGDEKFRQEVSDFIYKTELEDYNKAKQKAEKKGEAFTEEEPQPIVFNVNPDGTVNLTYAEWARLVSPKGSGQPGSGAAHNLNAFGRLFLAKMSLRDENGVSLMQKMHDMMSDPNMTGKEIRRWFIANTQGVGIDNKVVSFTLLVTGFKDVMVLDRVQIRQLWDDGQFAGKNLYDGRKVNNTVVSGSSLANLTMGARGLMIYEAIERALSERIEGIYAAVGREKDASIGRYHWETWVADSQQEASHGTLGAILPDARGDDKAIARVTVKQGEYGAYEYGARYGRTEDGEAYFVYNTPDGKEFEFTVPAFREFLTEISKPGKDRVVPSGFKVTESGNAPWYTRPEVNQQLLAEIAAKWADRDGGTGEGAQLVREAIDRKGLPNGTGFRYSRESTTVEPIPNDIGPLGFYSALSRNIAALDTKASTPAGWKQAITGMIKKGAVKQDEVEWTGLNDWLDLQEGRVTKEQVNEFLQNNGVRVEEIQLVEQTRFPYREDDEWFSAINQAEDEGNYALADELNNAWNAAHGSGDNPTAKYGQYTLPGGANYRELLLTLPIQETSQAFLRQTEISILLQDQTLTDGERLSLRREYADLADKTRTAGEIEKTYRSSHWDQPNILAHIRVNDRIDADGAKVLFVEELQSDWAQEGRKKGFDRQIRKGWVLREVDPGFFYLLKENESTVFASGNMEKIQLEGARFGAFEQGAPIAPFVTDTKGWLSLSIKRIMSYAVENNYDKVAFVNGKQSAERYKLSKSVQSIDVNQITSGYRAARFVTTDGKGFQLTVNPDGKVENGFFADQFIGKQLDEIIGKDMAAQIMAVETEKQFAGVDLDVGGEGMVSFYDKIVPNTIKDIIKKFGGDKLEMVDMQPPKAREEGGQLIYGQEQQDALLTVQPGFVVTPQMRQRVASGVPLFARGGYLGTADNLTQLLSESFGDDTARLLEAGQMQIVSRPADIPGGPHPEDVKAATAPDGTVYIVAQNVSPAEVRGIVLHEVGVHVGMEQMLGTQTFNDVLTQLDDAIMRGEEWAQAARDSVPSDTPMNQIREEQLAYLVQNSPELPLVQRIIAAVRAWAFRNFGAVRERLQLTEADYRALASSALRFAARQTELQGAFAPVYARGKDQDTSTAEQDLAAADANLKRVKSYASVLRAAADKLEDDAATVAAMRAQLPDISAQEIDELLIGLKTQVKNMRSMTRAAKQAMMASDEAAKMQSEAMRAADTLANNLEMAAVIQRRNAVLNLNARLKASSYVNQFKDKGLDFEGFAGLIVGTQRVRTGARLSVDGEFKGFRGEFIGGLIADIEKANLKREFISGRFDRDIYDALYRLGTDKPNMDGLPPQAVQIAQIVNKYQTVARNRRNRFGAWIRDLRGYITRQSHDTYKIRAATEDEWVKFVKDRLDLPKMIKLGLISETDPLGSLRNLYDDFAAGVHMKHKAGEEDMVALGRGSNLARRESVSRALYFKDGIAAYEYNQRFGVGTLAESVITGLERAAASAALLKNLGTNPEATLTRLMDEYENSLSIDPNRRAKFRQQRGAILNLLSQVDGSVYVPGNVGAAKVGGILRAWQNMAKLGGALISSVSDLAGYAAELRYSQGKNMLSGVLDGIVALTRGRASGERADILASLGVFHESVAGSISARFDSPELVAGKLAAAQQFFFRLNGLTWWTEALRDGAALQHSSYMAKQSNRAFADIDPELQRLLGLYNIDEGKWNIIRMAKHKASDGKEYISGDSLRTLPRQMFENYIASVGRTVNDASVANLMDDLQQALRIMMVDRAHHAVLEPNARARAFMLRGTKPGTLPGEVLRYIGQFKSFSIAMVQMVLGREVYGRGYDTVGEYLRKGRGDMVGLVTMIGMYTALGYAAMAIKDLIKGREPRNPLDYKTWVAAMAQGGGLGLYGDFLFGEYSRFGRSFSSSLLGPVIGNLDTLTDLWTRIRNGDDSAAAAFKALIDNTPFLNLYWLRPLLDYAILFNIQESLNPGFLRRMERRIETQNGQSFLFKPSEVIR